jgi:hypothetical protein
MSEPGRELPIMPRSIRATLQGLDASSVGSFADKLAFFVIDMNIGKDVVVVIVQDNHTR